MVSGGGLSIPVRAKKRPLEVPFFFADRDLACHELLVLPVRVAGISRQCLVIDAYCTSPKCPCRNALLWFVELPAQTRNEPRPSPGALLRVIEEEWYRGSPVVELLFDLKKGVFGTREEQLREVLTEAVSELREKFTSAHVKLFLEHRARVRAWGKENPWHLKDWTSFKPDGCVRWTTFFPSASLLTAFYEAEHHVFADFYCTNPACCCEEVLLTVGRREGSSGSAREVGLMRVPLQAGEEGKVKVEGGDPASLHGAFAELLASRPGVLGLFRRRKGAMREVGRFLETKKAALDMRDAAAPRAGGVEPSFLRESTIDVLSESGLEGSRSRVVVPRNASCPCGSGRKFKNCCGRNER